MTRAARQRGMALVIVLMLFAILSALAVEILYRQHRFLTRTDNLLQWDKRYQYAMAAEVVAQQGLIDDLDDDQNNDALVDDCVDEQWAVSLPPTPYDDALLSASVQDLQGRFNLNWLIDSSDEGLVRNEQGIAQLTRFIEGQFPAGTNASRLAAEMADWLDSNNLVDGVEGAEDAEYRYSRTPNMPAAHESELAALLSFQMVNQPQDPHVWGLLTALPLGTPLNVNTAPEAVLDAVLGPIVGGDAAAVVLGERKDAPILSIDDLFKKAPFSELEEDQKDALAKRLSVNSEFFQIMVDVDIDGKLSRLISRLRRRSADEGGTTVFSRQVSPLLSALEPACNPFYNQE